MFPQVGRTLLRNAARPATQPLFRRGYAEAASDQIKLTLALPHQSIYSSAEVVQVNVSTQGGTMGILSNHVPTIEELRPGLLEVIESGASDTKKWFVSGGFANVHPSNSITINAVEAYPLEDFSSDAIRSGLQEAQKGLGSANEEEKAIAEAEVSVYEALQSSVR